MDMTGRKISRDDLEKDVQSGFPQQREPRSAGEILDRMLERVSAVDFHAESRIRREAKIARNVFIVIVTEQILRLFRGSRYDLSVRGLTVYLYDGVKWIPVAEQVFKRFLGEAAKRMEAPEFDAKYYRFRDDLYKQFLASAGVITRDGSSSGAMINLQNGTLEFSDGRRGLREFRKEDFLTYQLPFEYDQAADCPTFRKFLSRSLPDEGSQMILAEYIGYVFAPSLKLEKALLLYGEGANGKSVIYEIISALLGQENISCYSLQSLTAPEGYQRAELGGKLLNYSSETNGRIDQAIFKQLVSGEPVEARFIYERAFILKHYARLMFNCNVLPRDSEGSRAFFRRFIIIPFDVSIPEGEQDIDLAKRIIKNELPGILNWVLEGLDRLLANKRFSHSEKVEEMSRRYEEMSHTVASFLRKAQISPGVSRQIRTTVLYSDYLQFCVAENKVPKSRNRFWDTLREKGFQRVHGREGDFIYCE